MGPAYPRLHWSDAPHHPFVPHPNATSYHHDRSGPERAPSPLQSSRRVHQQKRRRQEYPRCTIRPLTRTPLVSARPAAVSTSGHGSSTLRSLLGGRVCAALKS
ncbi:hypothetical protein K438DRAFT_375486 [Mycena galopus ATCC 62051]|nr:hypothetical protein K438DRAFT_375486 [Mycena galopus ATCC 62051]